MVEHSGKPPAKTPGAPVPAPNGPTPGHRRPGTSPGMGHEGDLQADDTLGAAERIRALVEPAPRRGRRGEPQCRPAQPEGSGEGYDPTAAGALGQAVLEEKEELRELSKWIELKRKLEQKKDGE